MAVQRQLHRTIDAQAAEQHLGRLGLGQRLQDFMGVMAHPRQHQLLTLPAHLGKKSGQRFDAGAVEVGGLFQAQHHRLRG